MLLKNQVAIVTGASGGIGKEIAKTLASEGANVVVNYCKNKESADGLVEEGRIDGWNITAIKADVTKREEIKAMADKTIEIYGTIDILVNNAGILSSQYFTFMKEEEWDSIIEVNLKGTFLCTKEVIKTMLKKRKGNIVNIASDAGLMGDIMRSHYASSKAGMIGFTKTLARELASTGIRVNAVSPGIILSPMTEDIDGVKKEKLLNSIPLARFGTPHDVAWVVRFLASDISSYITGQVICVDGGLHM